MCACSRPFQQQQLKQQQQQQPGYGLQHAHSAASDDNIRDQQHYYQHAVLYQHEAHTHTHALHTHHQQHQQHLAAQPSGGSLLGVQASLASLGAGGAAAQRPATLARAAAGVAGNAKDWKERVDKMNVLVEVLARQVRVLRRNMERMLVALQTLRRIASHAQMPHPLVHPCG